MLCIIRPKMVGFYFLARKRTSIFGQWNGRRFPVMFVLGDWSWGEGVRSRLLLRAPPTTSLKSLSARPAFTRRGQAFFQQHAWKELLCVSGRSSFTLMPQAIALNIPEQLCCQVKGDEMVTSQSFSFHLSYLSVSLSTCPETCLDTKLL